MPEQVMIRDLLACGYGFEDLIGAFPGETVAAIEQRYIDSALGLRRTVERFGYLATRPCESEFFNVSVDRTRRVQTVTPRHQVGSPITVGVFGGSIAMGAGLGDSETIPSRLQWHLDRASPGRYHVRNFAAMNHTSQHATLRFLDLSLFGESPDVAVFLDGWNDCFHAGGTGDGLVGFLDEVVRLAQSDSDAKDHAVDLRSILEKASSTSIRSISAHAPSVPIERTFLERRLSLSYELRRAVGSFTRTHVRSYWEPSVYHDCRSEQDPVPGLARANKREVWVREHMLWVQSGGLDRLFARHAVTPLLDIGKAELHGVLFVDRVHPAPLLADFLAMYIARTLALEALRIHGRIWWRRKKTITASPMPRTEANPDFDLYPMW